jgi:hypothetical protein
MQKVEGTQVSTLVLATGHFSILESKEILTDVAT